MTQNSNKEMQQPQAVENRKEAGEVSPSPAVAARDWQFDKQEIPPMIQSALDRLHDKIGLRDDLEDLKALLLEYAKACERIEQLERELADMTDDYMRLLREKQDALNASLLPSARVPTVLKTEVGPVPNLYCSYLVDGKLYRVCACDPFKGPCAKGAERKLLTYELSRCLIPDDSLHQYVGEKP